MIDVSDISLQGEFFENGPRFVGVVAIGMAGLALDSRSGGGWVAGWQTSTPPVPRGDRGATASRMPAGRVSHADVVIGPTDGGQGLEDCFVDTVLSGLARREGAHLGLLPLLRTRQ